MRRAWCLLQSDRRTCFIRVYPCALRCAVSYAVGTQYRGWYMVCTLCRMQCALSPRYFVQYVHGTLLPYEVCVWHSMSYPSVYSIWIVLNIFTLPGVTYSVYVVPGVIYAVCIAPGAIYCVHTVLGVIYGVYIVSFHTVCAAPSVIYSPYAVPVFCAVCAGYRAAICGVCAVFNGIYIRYIVSGVIYSVYTLSVVTYVLCIYMVAYTVCIHYLVLYMVCR